MENLISKWKNAQNSLKRDRSKSNVSSGGKNKYTFTSSSESDSGSPSPKSKINVQNRYVLPTKTDATVTSSHSNEPLGNRLNVVSPPRKSERKTLTSSGTPGNDNNSKNLNQSLKKTGTPNSNTEKSERKTMRSASQTNTETNENEPFSKYLTPSMKKSIPLLIDQAGYKIMDIFKYNSDLSNQEIKLAIEKLQRIKKVLEEVVDGTSSKTEELENQINALRQETKRMSLMSKTDTSSKIVNELEARLYESEREKMQLKKEKEQLLGKLNALDKEGEVNAINVELIQMLRKSQKTLEENNAQLMMQVQEAKRREEEQQMIWQAEVGELTEILKMLKDQLIQQSPENE